MDPPAKRFKNDIELCGTCHTKQLRGSRQKKQKLQVTRREPHREIPSLEPDIYYINDHISDLDIEVKSISDMIRISESFRNLIEKGFNISYRSCQEVFDALLNAGLIKITADSTANTSTDTTAHATANAKSNCHRCKKCNEKDILAILGWSSTKYNQYVKVSNMLDELREIDEMIGMEQIKTEFMEQVMYLTSLNPADSNPLMHSVIMGPPGHGKTHIARLIGRAFKSSGFLKNNKFVIARRADLISNVCGGTAKCTTAMFDQARGGVIFIDEIYSLGNEEKRDVFTKECIDTITQLLGERLDTICIVAGYEEEIQTCFFAYNDGLDRRFPWRFRIKEYKPDDLIKIFYKMIREDGFQVENEHILTVKDLQKDMFKNAGGDIMNLVTGCKIQHYRRTFLQNPDKILTRKDVTLALSRYMEHKKCTVQLVSEPPFGMYT